MCVCGTQMWETACLSFPHTRRYRATLFAAHCVCVCVCDGVCDCDASAWARCFRFTRNKLNGSHVRRICWDGVRVCVCVRAHAVCSQCSRTDNSMNVFRQSVLFEHAHNRRCTHSFLNSHRSSGHRAGSASILCIYDLVFIETNGNSNQL